MTNYSISPAEAAQELLIRREARQSLKAYIDLIQPDMPPALHHSILVDRLQDVAEGRIKRLMVFMPPGSAKSTYTSVNFPSWYLGAFAGQKLISASYETGLATQFGRKVRNLTEQDEYKRVFPDAGLTHDSKAKGEWELQNESSYYACGVGAGVTGRRGDGGIIDDPVKGRKEAESETVRQSTWDWYESDFMTRLKPDAWQVIIQTRWHQDDLSGRILPDDWDGENGWVDCGDHGNWFVVCIPAEARANDPLGRAEGEWLWPEWFTPDFWEATKRGLLPASGTLCTSNARLLTKARFSAANGFGGLTLTRRGARCTRRVTLLLLLNRTLTILTLPVSGFTRLARSPMVWRGYMAAWTVGAVSGPLILRMAVG